MFCHECAADGHERPAVGLCRFCSVALCKEHLVAAYGSVVQPQYACHHHPERAFAARTSQRAPHPLAAVS